MLAEILLPNTEILRLEGVVVQETMITVFVSSSQEMKECPDCHQASQREHSRYWRTIADLVCVDRGMQLCLFVRRLFCDNTICDRKTFTERFPDVIEHYARRTERLKARQCRTGLVLGGEQGARELRDMNMPVSDDTLLRLMRSMPQEPVETPRVLGVDDWAWRKGHTYGTILVDLENHRPVDLLKDRSADSLAEWLEAHPGVEIVSRDRAPVYIKGINQGAPDAIQVADRWHLIGNLKDALERIFDQNQASLYAAAEKEPTEAQEEAQTKPEPNPEEEKPEEKPLTRAERKRQATRQRRMARYEAVMDLHRQGIKQRKIARLLSMGRQTVRRYIQAGAFPEMAQRKKQASILDPFLNYLEQRWGEGLHNGSQLYREIQKQGYSGSRTLVCHWVAKMRQREPQTAETDEMLEKAKKKVKRPWSARYAAQLLLKEPEDLAPDKRAALKRMLQASPAIQRAYNFSQAFLRIVRGRLSKALQPWLDAVIENKIPGLSSLARSLEKDKPAVLAALSLPWSNGQVEGQVNRLKLIKRLMYGRAKFDLLRLRVLHSSSP